MKPEKRTVLATEDKSTASASTPAAHAQETHKSKPTHEQIAVVAYQIYEEAGRPDGFAEGHWDAAESSLNHGSNTGEAVGNRVES
jgi:hypothetical protein